MSGWKGDYDDRVALLYALFCGAGSMFCIWFIAWGVHYL